MNRMVAVSAICAFLSTVAWAGTLLDNFDAYDGNVDDGKMGNWRRIENGAIAANNKWFVNDGILVVESENSTPSAIIFDDGNSLTWRNYEYQIDFKIERIIPGVRPSVFGIGGRADDNRPGANGATLYHWTRIFKPWNQFVCDFSVEGKFFVRGDGDFPLDMEAWYTARFVVEENQFTAFFNDEQICNFEDNGMPEEGSVFLFASNVEAHFNNLRVTGDDIPNPGTSVDPKAKLATTWGEIKNRQ